MANKQTNLITLSTTHIPRSQVGDGPTAAARARPVQMARLAKQMIIERVAAPTRLVRQLDATALEGQGQ